MIPIPRKRPPLLVSKYFSTKFITIGIASVPPIALVFSVFSISSSKPKPLATASIRAIIGTMAKSIEKAKEDALIFNASLKNPRTASTIILAIRIRNFLHFEIPISGITHRSCVKNVIILFMKF